MGEINYNRNSSGVDPRHDHATWQRRSENSLLTVLKIVAGAAVLGIIAMLLIAVTSGLIASAGSLKKKKNDPRE